MCRWFDSSPAHCCKYQADNRLRLPAFFVSGKRDRGECPPCRNLTRGNITGLVIIDTEASPRLMSPMKDRIEVTFHRNDWAYVINTHAHDNHCSGNSLFQGATIIGHDNLAEDMEWLIHRQTDPDRKRRELERYDTILRDLQAALPRYAANSAAAKLICSDLVFYKLFVQDLQEGYEVAKPTLTFADTYTLDLGDLTLKLIFFGKGHSNSDILIYIPQDGILVSGAIAYQQGHLPEIGEQTRLEDVHRFIRVLDGLLADGVKIDRVIPGHSPPLTRRALPPIRDYYQRMLTEVQAARNQGLTLDETLRRARAQREKPLAHPRRRTTLTLQTVIRN